MDILEMATKPKCLHHYFIKTSGVEDVAVIYDPGAGSVETLSYGELDEFANLVMDYIKPLIKRTNFIGVACSPGINLPAMVLGILRLGRGYYCLDYRCNLADSKSVIDTLEIDIILADKGWLANFGGMISDETFENKSLELRSTTVSIIKTNRAGLTEQSKMATSDSFTWAYASRTSGTTGKRKIILVPHASITPNIQDFIRIENVTEQDVLFGASPPTFDPFNVDLFTALGSHAKILFVADSVKLNPKELTRALLAHGVTILHCTPSLLLRFGEIEAARLFEAGLRILALGGERCLEKDHLRKLIPLRKISKLLILNLYGTTEVSCWASIAKINLENDNPVSIGESLSETDVRLFENDYRNQIYIGSRTRVCTVLYESDGSPVVPISVDGATYRETGDLGELSEYNLITFNGRLDRMIKRHGHFVNLTDIENRVMLSNLLSLSATFYFFGKIFLIVKFKADLRNFDLESSKLKLGKCLEKYLPIHYYPDKIIVISEDVPVTGNGKLDVNYIKEIVMLEQQGEQRMDFSSSLAVHYPPEDVDEFILTTWKNNTGNRNEFDASDTFFEAGGNSARAVRFVEEIMQGLLKFGTRIHADEENLFLNTLNRCPFHVVRKYIFKSICEEKPHIVEVSPLQNLTDGETEKYLSPNKNWVEPGYRRVPLSAVTTSEEKIENIELILENPIVSREWTIDLLGCVDATPIILTSKYFRCKGRIVLVGSHSGYIAAVNLEVLRETDVSNAESSILWRKKFPDRIATTAGIHSSQLFAFIVCCDEIMYTICVETGAIRWFYQINGLTRSTPVCSSDGKTVYLLSCFPNGQLTAINFEDGVKLWSTTLSFVTAPLSIGVIDSGILVTTSDVSIIKITTEGTYSCCRGEVERTCTPPLALYLPSKTLVLVGTLKGSVVAFDEDLMQETWMYLGPEGDPVNPPCFHRCDVHPGVVIFTTHSGAFRILDAEKGSLIHKLKLRIESRSSPVCYTKINIGRAGNPKLEKICCAVLTDVVGGIHFLNIDTGKKIGVVQPNQSMECFSSPVICGDLVAFGGTKLEQIYVALVKY